MVTSATDTTVSQVTVWSLQQQTLRSESVCLTYDHFSNRHYSQSGHCVVTSATDTESVATDTESVRSKYDHFNNRPYSQSGHCVVTSAYSVVNRRQSGHSVVNRHLSQSQVIVWSTDVRVSQVTVWSTDI